MDGLDRFEPQLGLPVSTKICFFRGARDTQPSKPNVPVSPSMPSTAYGWFWQFHTINSQCCCTFKHSPQHCISVGVAVTSLAQHLHLASTCDWLAHLQLGEALFELLCLQHLVMHLLQPVHQLSIAALLPRQAAHELAGFVYHLVARQCLQAL